ncbi:MAG: hypothetical protein RL160_1513 [Bacteroidota bacterium]|jgi:predicted HTH domain antitoxin
MLVMVPAPQACDAGCKSRVQPRGSLPNHEQQPNYMAMLIVHGKNDLYLSKVKILTIHIPDTVDFDDQEALLAIAAGMYGKGKLTLGQAADLAGMSKQAFMEILGDYGVSVFNFPSSDLDRDIANAKSYHL